MYQDTIARRMADEGLRNIESAILRLLNANPSGLTNAQIANSLGLLSEVGGGQRNWLTYSVLGRLVDRGIIAKGQQRRPLYTRL